MRDVVYTKFPTGPLEAVPEWATYIQTRHPRLKLHETIGPAKSAITRYRNGILFRAFPGRQGTLTYKAVAVVNSADVKTHPYRRSRPDQLVNEVVLFKIEEPPQLDAT